MIHTHSELKTNLNTHVINLAVKEVQAFLENAQNEVLTSIASEGYVRKTTHNLPRTDKFFIHSLKSFLEMHGFKYEIKNINDLGGPRDVVIIEWNLNLE